MPDIMPHTKIVATVGPSTRSEDQLEAIIRAGVDVVRLNFSHGVQEEHGQVIERVRSIARRLDRPIAILQDLQGPKIRTGLLAREHAITLIEGSEISITTRPVEGTSNLISTTYPQLATDVRPGARMLLDDGRLELRALDSDGTEIRVLVIRGGVLGEHKGINLPGVAVSAPSLTEKDLADLSFGIAHGVDFVALSFVREANDIVKAKKFIKDRGVDVPVIAKLEKPEALAHLDSILRVSDGVMVARGDLGVEMPPEKVPVLQKSIVKKASQRGLPVIIATQMLESMVHNPSPTRAEASDVANAILDGADAVMLSAETSIGSYPVEAVEMICRIAIEAESQAHRMEPPVGRLSLAQAMSRAACSLARDLDMRAIAVLTRTGHSARLLSQERPMAPIYAFTPDERAYRRMVLWWGVRPFRCEFKEHTDAMIAQVETELLQRGLVQRGDNTIIVGSSPLVVAGVTNFIKVHKVGRPGPAGGSPDLIAP